MDNTKLSIIRGDTKTWPLTFYSDEAKTTPINITGWTIFFTVKEKTDAPNDSADTSAKIKKDVTSHSDPTHGVTSLTLSPTDTDIEPGTYLYDLQVKKANGDVKTIMMGDISTAGSVMLSRALIYALQEK